MNIIKNRKGFTLIELIIVIVIIGILSVVSVPIYRKYITEASMTEGYTLVGAVARAEVIYANTKGGGKFLKWFDLRDSYYGRELGIKLNGQYHYFNRVCVESVSPSSRCSDAVSVCACGYADGIENAYEPICVCTTVCSDGHIEDLREGFGENSW